jgi:decaprenylphospho-beta-D-erythro-pentofuranosid-2-ulose 2-reductase
MNSNKSATTVLIVGARSDIAQALAHTYGATGANLILAARNVSTLEPLKSDLILRYAISVVLIEFNLLAPVPEGLVKRLPLLPDTVVMMAGLLGTQSDSVARPDVADVVMQTNYVAPARLLLAFAAAMESRGNGTIIGVSSVAGDRGRASNYIYGAAKAGLTAFLSGLRASLTHSGVHVLTVKPGFVRTAMTKDMKLPAPITADPEEVADAIVRAARARKNVIYVRPVWRAIMTIIRFLPESVFKRLNL